MLSTGKKIKARNNLFDEMDKEYEQDVKYLESIGDRAPTDDEWQKYMKIGQRTWNRLFELTYIEGGVKRKN